MHFFVFFLFSFPYSFVFSVSLLFFKFIILAKYIVWNEWAFIYSDIVVLSYTVLCAVQCWEQWIHIVGLQWSETFSVVDLSSHVVSHKMFSLSLFFKQTRQNCILPRRVGKFEIFYISWKVFFHSKAQHAQ